MRAVWPRGWIPLRHRAALVAVSVAALPLLLVWLSALGDAALGQRMAERGLQAAARAAPQVGRPDTAAQVEALARKEGLWMRVIDEDGRVVVDANHDAATGLAAWSQALFFGPEGPPTLAGWELSAGPPGQRLVALAAEQGRASHTCTFVEGHRLLVCEAARVAGDGRSILYVVESSQAAIRSLHDARYPLLKLTLISGVLALVLGAWLGWRMVRPIEQLRAQVLDRSRSAALAPVALDRRDELGDLARAFNRLLGALRDRGAANEAFAADLAHEVKNPVAAVRAASERLSAGGPIDAERAARLGRVLREASDRLERLSNRFLELARAEAGLVHSHRERVPMGLLAERLVERLAADPRAEGVRLAAVVAGPCVVLAVAERLETVLMNLLDNALRFAPEGVGPPQVTVTVAERAGRVEVRVEDSGPGVPIADRERVFQRFFSRRPGGTGLGLALCQAIVEAHGGEIALEPGPAGCGFFFWLPTIDSQPR